MLHAVSEQIQEATPDTTAVVQSLISHLANHLIKMSKISYEVQRVKKGQTHMQHYPKDS